MAAGIELVTGYTGVVHITSDDDGGGYASIVGPGNYVSADVGRAMAAELPDANTLRVYDGEAWMGGRHVRIPRGSYVDVPIESGTQGQQRHDVVAIRYTKDPATGKESCDLVCVKGTPGSSSAPATLSGSPLTGSATCDMPLYRVDLNGISPAAPVRLFTSMASAATRKVAASDITSGVLPVVRGGTGQTRLTGNPGLIHSQFDTNLPDAGFIPVFTDGWGDGGYMNPTQLRTKMGTPHIRLWTTTASVKSSSGQAFTQAQLAIPTYQCRPINKDKDFLLLTNGDTTAHNVGIRRAQIQSNGTIWVEFTEAPSAGTFRFTCCLIQGV